MVSISFAFWKDTNNLAGAVKQYRNGKDFAVPSADLAAALQALNPSQLAASANVVQTLPGSQTSRDRLQDDLHVSAVRYVAVADQVLNLYVEESWDNSSWATRWASGNTSVGQLADSGWVALTRRYWRFRAVNTSGSTATTTFAAWEALAGGHTVPRTIQRGVADSVNALPTKTTAPTAGTALCTLSSTVLPVGTYEVEVSIGFGAGSPVSADAINFELKAGSTVVAGLMTPPSLSGALKQPVLRVSLDGSTSLTVNAIANATAAVDYLASITATRIG